MTTWQHDNMTTWQHDPGKTYLKASLVFAKSSSSCSVFLKMASLSSLHSFKDWSAFSSDSVCWRLNSMYQDPSQKQRSENICNKLLKKQKHKKRTCSVTSRITILKTQLCSPISLHAARALACLSTSVSFARRLVNSLPVLFPHCQQNGMII